MIEIEELAKYIKPDTNGLPTLYYEGNLRSPELQAEYEKADKAKWIEFVKNSLNDNLFLPFINNFPYDLVNAYHFVVWINQNHLDKIESILELVAKTDCAGFEYIYFQHQSQNKSIKNLIHFHFLLKKL